MNAKFRSFQNLHAHAHQNKKITCSRSQISESVIERTPYQPCQQDIKSTAIALNINYCHSEISEMREYKNGLKNVASQNLRGL